VIRPKLSTSSLDLKPLYYLLHVAEAGSFSKAGAILSIGQPIISRAIRSLEQDLRVPLLHRNGRGVTLTSAGQRLLAGSKTIFKTLSETRDDIAAGCDVAAGTVDVAMPPLFGDLVTVDLIRRLRAEFPLISLHIREGYATESVEWLSAGLIDIGLLFYAPNIATLLVQHVLDDELHLVGRTGSLDSVASGVQAQYLAKVPLLLPPEPHRLRMLVDSLAHEAAIDLQVEAEVSGIATMLELVRAGIGYTVVPSAIVRGLTTERRLQSCPIIQTSIKPRLSIATSMQRPQTTATRVVLRLMLEQFARAPIAIASLPSHVTQDR
jgi:LysR family nitrogen assimilation transcriptional regulator